MWKESQTHSVVNFLPCWILPIILRMSPLQAILMKKAQTRSHQRRVWIQYQKIL
ncbi:hypothetical protein DPMN_042367 [Dreissena polymorpha]|uniref:Uncharacterized protein n=1 Tax=Dreissena polymorpha TaxID=45954 RepID=A0A9D4D0A1_DREPO|nr:hypothetical protein DPMN_042367 [Dreissena polymorpha]